MNENDSTHHYEPPKLRVIHGVGRCFYCDGRGVIAYHICNGCDGLGFVGLP